MGLWFIMDLTYGINIGIESTDPIGMGEIETLFFLDEIERLLYHVKTYFT